MNLGDMQAPLYPEDDRLHDWPTRPSYSEPPMPISNRPALRRPVYESPQRSFDTLDYLEQLITLRHNWHVRRSYRRGPL